MARIVLDGITQDVRDEVIAVDDVSLEIDDGEFMVLVGPSGCGKSTILRMMAGLEEVTAGEIVDRRRAGHRPAAEGPRHRDGVPELRALPAHDRRAEPRVRAEAPRHPEGGAQAARVQMPRKILGLEPLLERKPAALSGGQRQRVAMGRAMVREPLAFLMDEPLSNLDAKLRVQMRAELHAAARPPGDHDRLRDARPGRGDDARRPRRGAPRRRAAAGRHPAAAVHAPREPVRGGVHRLAADEPRRGRRRRRDVGFGGFEIPLAPEARLVGLRTGAA